jgi:GrpB-like predicted nucleotidyltransferase (UPF0157 family)
MIGLKRGSVKLENYNEMWKKIFEEESKLISSTINEFLIDIQHTGSTAIPGMAAKPIIDIAVAIDSLSNIEKIIQFLQEVGYHYRGEQGISGRHLFAKGDEENRTHYLHIMEKNHPEWKNHILFRDYLKSNPKVAKEYERIKRELAKKYESDRGKYTEGKSKFIQKIIENANL